LFYLVFIVRVMLASCWFQSGGGFGWGVALGMARFDALDLGFAPWARRRCFTSGEAKVSSKSRCRCHWNCLDAFGGLMDVLRGSDWTMTRWKQREKGCQALDMYQKSSETCLIPFIGMWEQLMWALQLTRRCAFGCWLKRLGADLLSQLDHIAIEVFLSSFDGKVFSPRSLQFMWTTCIARRHIY
jgi:hypothetical protein